MYVKTLTAAVNLIRELRTSNNVNESNPNNTTGLTIIGGKLENKVASKSLLQRNWLILIDEVHQHATIDLSYPVHLLAKVPVAAIQLYELKNILKIEYAYGLTATPMTDKPIEMFRILGTLATMVGLKVPDIHEKKEKFVKDKSHVKDGMIELLTIYKAAGALLHRKKMGVNDKNGNNNQPFLYPIVDLENCYFDPYVPTRDTTPVMCEMSESVMEKHMKSVTKGRTATIQTFNKDKTIAWSKGNVTKAIKHCLNSKLETIKKLVEDAQDTPILIYSQHVIAGVYDIQKYLSSEISGKVVALTGESSSTTVKTQMDMYNARENQRGEYIKVMIISAAMATGYNFRNTQLMILVEPDHVPGMLQQAIGRVVRRKCFDPVLINKKEKAIRGEVRIVGLLSTSKTEQMTYDQQVYENLKIKWKNINYASQAFNVVKNIQVKMMNLNKISNTDIFNHIEFVRTMIKDKQFNNASNANRVISSYKNMLTNKKKEIMSQLNNKTSALTNAPSRKNLAIAQINEAVNIFNSSVGYIKNIYNIKNPYERLRRLQEIKKKYGAINGTKQTYPNVFNSKPTGKRAPSAKKNNPFRNKLELRPRLGPIGGVKKPNRPPSALVGQHGLSRLRLRTARE